MPSIFARIVAREIPAHILREDDDYLAFLDVRPIREGHTLVIPKDEFQTCSIYLSLSWRACCRSPSHSRERFKR
jgi:diadenosine tetraphosphate (Ap4A) HIT family hydrolase